MGSHTLLSPSSASRWLNCPPSARMCESHEDGGSDYAAEGTDAHTLCEYKLKTALGFSAADPTESLAHYSDEMEACARDYADYVLGLTETARLYCLDPLVLIEQRLDFSQYAPDGFGTGDCIIVADGTLHVIDFKYGQGVLVDAEDNPQMKLYALGALELFNCLYDITEVSVTVYQPRRDNISIWTTSTDSLYQWAEEVLKPTAALAYAGEGEYRCGEWCRFCKIKNECRARADHNLALARYDFRLPPLLEDDEIEAILAQVDGLVSWASDIKDYAFQTALKGKQWNDWKLVASRSSRRYTNEDAVAKAVTDAGFDPYERTVLGVTALEKRLGKERFKELLSGLIEKPPGKPTLAPISDKRKAIDITKQYFMEE